MSTNQLPPLPEPDSYQFQHDETGQTMFVDRQQVEWGFEANNPRLHKIGGAFTADQMHAYALAALAQQAQGVPDGVWEALQRLIENGGSMGPASQEDAILVAQYRDRVRFMTPPASQAQEPVAWLAWQARAALQSPAPQAGWWLPIESAPKDGTRLILWWGGKPVFAGWLDNSQCKHPWAGWQTPSLTPRPQGEPTHYMPPPPAPQTKGQP